MRLKWRPKLNKVDIKKALRSEYRTHPSGRHLYFIFKCELCPKEISGRKSHLPYLTGRCKKHANMHKPYEAVYGGLIRNARERQISFDLSYEDYLKFTGKPCFYCGNPIPWQPWNEHGVNNPGYYLDRKDSEKGYSVNNCVPCCTRCNISKRRFSSEDFINMCKQISKNHDS